MINLKNLRSGPFTHQKYSHSILVVIVANSSIRMLSMKQYGNERYK